MPDDTDVQTTPSTVSADPVIDPAAPAPVSAEVGEPIIEDRPLKNLQSEFNRKFGKLESSLSAIETLLQQSRPAAPAAPAQTGWDQYSDEQLMELYRAGSTDAGLKLNERMVSRQVQTATAATSKAQSVQNQLSVLYAKYPQLRDTTSPLYLAAMRVKGALLNTGMHTNSPETDVQAILVAIADNVDLARTQEPTMPTRRDQTTAQNQLDGSTTRRQPATKTAAPALSQRELDIAKRMGVKDPSKSRERFLGRQAKNQSSVTPMIAVAMREES